MEGSEQGETPTVRLRRTTPADLDFVLAIERDAENAPFIGMWSRDEHLAAIGDAAREHCIIERAGNRRGFLIAYDLAGAGHGVYVKRIVVSEKNHGVGRQALLQFAQHAFRDLAAPFVWLSVYPENERAQRAYRAIGFTAFALSPERRALLRAAVDFSERSRVLVLHPEPAAK